MANVTAHTQVEAWHRAIIFRTWNLSCMSLRELASRLIFFAMVVAVLIIATISVIIAIKWIDKPFAGFLVNERMVLGNVGQYHWTGTQAGLKFPDKILKANDRSVSGMRDLEDVIQKTGVGRPIRYSIERAGRVIDVTIATMRFTWWDLLMTFGVTFISGVIYLFIGVVVFILKPDTKVSWAFLLACAFLSLYAITSFDIQSTHSGFIRIYLFVNTFFPATFIHLSLIFPERTRLAERYPSLEVFPYITSAILVIPLEVLYPQPAFMAVYQWVRLYTIACAVLLLASTLRAYFVGSSVLARQRAKVLLFGAALAFPIPAFAHYVSLFGASLIRVVIQNNFLAIPILFFPASIAYAITKHNLFDVDVYIKRTVGYAIMTAIVGVGYFSIQTVTSAVLFTPLLGDYAQDLYSIAFALLVVFFFNPINRKVQDTVDRIFFRRKFDYKETVTAVSNALTSLLNLDEILRQVVQTIRTQMFVDAAGVIVLRHKRQACQAFFIGDVADSGKEEVKDLHITLDDPLLDLISREKSLITKYDIDEDPSYRDVKESCGQSFAHMSASLAIPLIYKGEVTGAVALGRKKSGHFYSREDVDLLTTMAAQAAVAIENAKLAEQMRREETVRTNLARYLSPQIVDQIVKKDVQVNLGGDKRVVTVLFSDIRNFTSITESRPPDQLVHILNQYFTEMASIIFANQGSLDKYIGDAIVAVFGSLITLENSARNAVQAAIQMMNRLPILNERWMREYGFTMQIGIGINTGEVFLGNIGSPERMEFTVIGDTVNVASRFSGLARPGQVLVTRETLNRLGSADIKCSELPLAEVKGKAEKIEVYEVIWKEPAKQ